MGNRIKKIVGQNIRYYREEKGWNQAQLGYIAFGITPVEKNKNKAQQKITKLETDKKEPTVSELYKIAKALKVDIKKFFETKYISINNDLPPPKKDNQKT